MPSNEEARDCLRSLLRHSELSDDGGYIEKFGAVGVQVYMEIGAELCEGPPAEAQWHSSLFNLIERASGPETLVRGTLDASRSRAASMGSFLETTFHHGHTLSLSALLLSRRDSLDEADLPIALWVIGHEARQLENPAVLHEIAELLCAGLIVFGCRFHISLYAAFRTVRCPFFSVT
jgi:hypothetical protein